MAAFKKMQFYNSTILRFYGSIIMIGNKINFHQPLDSVPYYNPYITDELKFESKEQRFYAVEERRNLSMS